MHRIKFNNVYMFSFILFLYFSFSWGFYTSQVLSQEKEVKILPGRIISHFMTNVPITDPLDRTWTSVGADKVELIAQDVQEPTLEKPSVSSILVRSLNNGRWISFQLEWEDGTEDTIIRSEKFSDSAAVELPLWPQKLPDHRMGSDGQPVHLMLWKASSQRASEDNISFTAQNYPNMWCDYYLFERFCGSAISAAACEGEVKKVLPALAVNNPVVPGVVRVVEELYAESWNKVVSHENQFARGRGVWKDGRWRLVVSRPMVSEDARDASLEGRSKTFASFAVWDGGSNNVGSRKMVSDGWIELEIEQ